MKKSSIILLQAVVVVVGLLALGFMLFEPHFEGRNVNATLFQIYFNDPFLAYAYAVSIAFFAALYQVFKLLGYAGKNKIFSLDSVRALRIIKYCTRSLVGFIVAAEVHLFVFERGKDDITGGVFMGLLLIFAFGVTSIVAGVLEHIAQSTVDIQSKNSS